MIRTLLTTTALAALLTTGAIAQEAATSTTTTTEAPAAGTDMLTQGYQFVDTDGLASRLIGFPVYTSAAADAERLGEINDLIINKSGNVAAVIVGVGGFLGVGEKNVAVDYTQLQWVTAADNTERLVLEATKEALNAAPAVEYREDEVGRAAAVPAQPDAMQAEPPADTAAAKPDAATEAEPPADTAAAQPDKAAEGQQDTAETGSVGTKPGTTPPATEPVPIDRQALTELDEMTLTAEELIGTNVYGPNDEFVGVIGDFVLAEDGKMIDAVVVDVGGFLGIGAKEVAIGFDNLDFAVDASDNRFLLVDATKDQLEAQAEFNRDTYKNERDTQRMMVSLQ